MKRVLSPNPNPALLSRRSRLRTFSGRKAAPEGPQSLKEFLGFIGIVLGALLFPLVILSVAIYLGYRLGKND